MGKHTEINCLPEPDWKQYGRSSNTSNYSRIGDENKPSSVISLQQHMKSGSIKKGSCMNSFVSTIDNRGQTDSGGTLQTDD